MIDYEAAAGTAPSVGNLPFLESDCDHKVVIVESKNQVGMKGNRYIIKVRILESVSTKAGVEAPQPGADRCVIINLDPPKNKTQPDYGMQNLMNYAYGLNGGPIEGADPKIKAAKLQRLLGQRKVDAAEAARYRVPECEEIKAFAIGMIVGDRAVGGTTAGQNNQPGHAITYHNWYSLKQTPEEVLERKAAIAAGQPVKYAPAK